MKLSFQELFWEKNLWDHFYQSLNCLAYLQIQIWGTFIKNYSLNIRHQSCAFCPRRNLNSVGDYIVLQAWVSSVCRVSVVSVSNFKDGIFPKRFELESWNFVWCFLMTCQARFSSRKKIGPPQPPQPPYPPQKQVRRANFYNFHPMSMKFYMEVTFLQPKRNT